MQSLELMQGVVILKCLLQLYGWLSDCIISCIEMVPTVEYGSRHEIFTGGLLWHVTGRDQGVAKLSSLQRC